jgi:hypothetical protein
MQPGGRAQQGGGRYSIQELADQSGLAPENLTTLAHFSVSSAMSFPKSAGDPETVVLPRPASCALILGSDSAALIYPFSFSMIPVGEFLGAPMPFHPPAS